MRENPDIDQLRRQAKELLVAYRAQSSDAVLEVDAHHHSATPETFALHDAQFVVARSYGFESWPKLKAAVEGVTTRRLHEAVKKGDLVKRGAIIGQLGCSGRCSGPHVHYEVLNNGRPVNPLKFLKAGTNVLKN